MSGLILVSLALTACGTDDYGYQGVQVFEYFVLDGARSWQYANEAYEWKMRVDLNPAFTELDGTTRVVSLDYLVDDPIALLYTIKWSSDGTDGVLIHGYTIEGAEQETVTLDPPVVFSNPRAKKGTSFETVSGGTTWTSTFEDLEVCPNYWVSNDWDCLRFVLDDGGAGVPFAGSWWIAADWGTSRFQRPEDTKPWQLAQASWTPEE